MNFTIRLVAFLLIAVAGFVAWHWTQPPDDVTPLAVRQFETGNSVVAELERATWVQSWRPMIWPALVIVIGIVMFWDDAEKWWTNP